MSLKTQILNKSSRLSSQLVRYLLVGGVAFAFDFAVLTGLTELAGLHYAWGAACGFAVGLLTNYVLSVAWVFSERNVADRKLEFLIFALVGVLGLGLTEGIMWCGVEQFGIDYRLVKLFAVGVVLVWNFAARKFLLFREEAPLEATADVTLAAPCCEGQN